MGCKESIMRVNGSVQAGKVFLADSFLSRFRGLMGKKSLPPDYCLILTPCNAIHMAFMKIPLDIAYLDRNGVVIALQWNLKPWRIGEIHKGAHSVMEAPVGGILRNLHVGDSIRY